ncbi:MAG: TRAP transporter large permease [Rhodoferax sp.]|jgi:tripartite ATP-independent transporter DctM subunit|nr:TRAP transporter large permease [Rhodoferax sp.]MCP5287582.1 TRAP transporter large permease [Burkholderiaceae bacterium]
MLEVALLALAVLVVALSIGVPLPMCFGAGLMVMSLLGGVTMKGTMLWGFGQLGNPVLLAIPLFILAGTLMSVSGIAASLLKLVDVFIGHVRGGLGVVATLSCAVIGAISGSGLTGVAAIGPLLIPEMTKQGYPRGYATALVACSSVLGLLIPPSVTMIVYGWVTDTSILASFLATLGPGLMITASLIVVNLVTARRFDLQLQARPDLATMLAQARRRSLVAAPALLMPVIILGGIYGGVLTPTEAAAVAVIYAVPVGAAVYRGLNLRTLFEAGKEAGTAVGAIMLMILFSMILSQMFTLESIPQRMVDAVFGLTQDRILILLLVNLVLFVVGMIVNDITAIILLAPLLMPLMKAIGVDPVHFAAIMGVNTALGGITPPYASILYMGARIGNARVVEVVGPALRLLLLGFLPTVLLTTYWPELALFFPRLFGY